MPALLTPAPASPPPAAADLEARVAVLWTLHASACRQQRQARQKLTRLRAELGARLAEVKSRLAGAGRDGEWGPWLQARGIPRATADRLVRRHLHPDPEPPAALPAGPLPADLQPALDRVLEWLRPLSPDGRFRCLEALGPALDLVCHHRGLSADLLIERPGGENGGENSGENGDEDETEAGDGTDTAAGEGAHAGPGSTVPAAAPATRGPGMAPGVNSLGSSSSVRNFFRRLVRRRRPARFALPASAAPRPGPQALGPAQCPINFAQTAVALD